MKSGNRELQVVRQPHQFFAEGGGAVEQFSADPAGGGVFGGFHCGGF